MIFIAIQLGRFFYDSEKHHSLETTINSNSLTTIPQSSALTIIPQEHTHPAVIGKSGFSCLTVLLVR